MKKFKKVLGVVACVAILLGVFAPAVSANETLQSTLAVEGSARVMVVPDRAYVSFSIRTLDDDPIVSQEMNRNRSNEIYAALAAIGVSASDTQTQWYHIRRHYEWEMVSDQMPVEWDHYGNPVRFMPNHWYDMVFRGYETTHSISVTLNNIDVDASMIGRVLDVSVAHGANMASGVTFAVSPDRREVAYLEALGSATRIARSRAEAVIGPLGINNIRPVTVNIENIRINVPGVTTTVQDSWSGGWDSFARMEMSALGSSMWFDNVPVGGEFTPISPGEIPVSASVSLIFTF